MSSSSKKRIETEPTRSSSPGSKLRSSDVESPKTSSKKRHATAESSKKPVEEEDSAGDASLSDSDSDASFSDSDVDITDQATSSQSSDASSSDRKITKKLSWLEKKKKGLASKAAGSSLGAGIFEKYVDKETQSLIDSICAIIAKEQGSKAAKKTKKEILKVAVKILLLYNAKKVTEESFETLVFSFRRICSSVRNAYHAKSLNEATATRIHGVALVFYQNLQTSLAGLVSENTMQRILSLINNIFSTTLLVAATKYDKEFQQIAMVLATYLG